MSLVFATLSEISKYLFPHDLHVFIVTAICDLPMSKTPLSESYRALNWWIILKLNSKL